MKPVLTPQEMTAADNAAIAAGTPAEVLLTRAGSAVAWESRKLLGETYGRRVLVACGPGNNGGDGRIAAQILSGWGAKVEVLDIASPAATAQLGAMTTSFDQIIDAMYGTGFRDELNGVAARVAEMSYEIPTVAVDIPSGVNGTTGAVKGKAVRAQVTVTFSAHKPGICFEPGRGLAGDVRVAQIGIAVGSPDLTITTEADVRQALATRQLSNHDFETHKWKSGLLVIGGSRGMVGAPLLVSRAAMRVGAGIVWCAVPGKDAATRASGSEVIMHALPETRKGSWRKVGTVANSFSRFQAMAIGPGLGLERSTGKAVRATLSRGANPVVLDADGLRAFSGCPELLKRRSGSTIVTPHAGEFLALTGRAVGDDRALAARELAQRSGAVVLLKGPATVVADPSGRAAINPSDGPWLATAGSGDVLTGIIGGLLARGLAPFAAATVGAWLHCQAADEAGHTGMVAGDLIDALPRVLDRL